MVLDKKIFRILCILLSASLLSTTQAEEKSVVSQSINEFATNLLRVTSEEAGDSLNVALSPFTIWTLLTIISEGARGNSLKQLEMGLNLPTDRDLLRNMNRDMTVSLLKGSPGVSLEVSNAVFTTKEHKLNSSFQQIAKKYYNVEVMPTDFTNVNTALQQINDYVRTATKGRVQNFVSPSDLVDTYIFLTSTMHFKGMWTIPFNKSATSVEPFYDDKGNKIGTVNMMYQMGPYGYTRVENISSYVVELPYGKGDRASMVVVLPYKDESVVNVLKKMSKYPLTSILKDLKQSLDAFPDDDVLVYLPKFKTNSDLNMNVVLEKMGIEDIFSSARADLLGIFPHYLYVNRLIQKAEIDVNEEGTEASAAAGAGFGYKSPPPKFKADKPFLYFIVDKPTGCIMFEGKVTNPTNL